MSPSCLIVVGIGSLLIAIDYSIRWNDWTMRFVQSSLFVAAILLVLRYRIVVGLTRRPSLSMVAKKLEQVFSIPRGWLLSLVDWKDGEQVESGISQELQLDAMRTIEIAVHRHRLESILDPKPCILWTLMAALCLAVLTGIAAFSSRLDQTIHGPISQSLVKGDLATHGSSRICRIAASPSAWLLVDGNGR